MKSTRNVTGWGVFSPPGTPSLYVFTPIAFICFLFHFLRNLTKKMVFVCYHDSVQPDAQKQGMTAAAAGDAGVCLCSLA
ncbi:MULTISPECIES: hypothetical protein [Edwardsiella]|uniref:Uncharacterized protein n=1 Tax=Edwardsiella anguillarum TaxID=1821960 RepID=A0ABY8SB81_9GAMM|nr:MULTISPECIES: hypothetical protein [Edwardsiella]KAB0588139.1 hypothetical protein F7P84_17235 [Edwardsiella anguillarum]UBU94672.1 hypothetical protein AAZ33_19525 [Edwardsiella sp. LADL05-105]UOU78228.1 hypothetical protein MUN71_14380 [Edwardsiella anguillarum]WHP82997.1 hypothetical protein MQ095_14520 [Edwardsiella anguillarum]WHP86793.1 hypothetical protein MQ088_14520 [Edwardsiella anguillarum]